MSDSKTPKIVDPIKARLIARWNAAQASLDLLKSMELATEEEAEQIQKRINRFKNKYQLSK